MSSNYEKPAFWMKRTAQYTATCERCGQAIVEGDEVWMKPELQADGRKRWLVVCASHGEPGK